MAKKRLDALVLEQYPHYSKTQIQSWIMQGKVLVKGHPQTKPGTQVAEDSEIELIAEDPKFVCRAGLKLEKALEHFNINVTDKVILDAGLSTGGFTDCLLQKGARKVYGVDVGYGQVHEKIRTDQRVVLMERTNLRHVTTVGENVDLVTLDLSFISVLKVMDAVCAVLKPQGELVVLVKPQFEAEREEVGSGGIIRDDALRSEIAQRVIEGIQARGFEFKGMTESPIQGGSGNIEFLAYFVREQFLLKANKEYESFTEKERHFLQQEIAEWDVTLSDGIDHD